MQEPGPRGRAGELEEQKGREQEMWEMAKHEGASQKVSRGQGCAATPA